MAIRRTSLKKYFVGQYELLSWQQRERYGDMVIVTSAGIYTGRPVMREDLKKEHAYRINDWVDNYRRDVRVLSDLGDFDGMIELQDATFEGHTLVKKIPYVVIFMDQINAIYTTEFPDQDHWTQEDIKKEL